MDGRSTRGRGGSWKRSDRGGHDSGEHRGRGRGGPHRGRDKRDHRRGRGRGGSSHVTEFHYRGKDEGENFQEEDDTTEVFSRRKLESNWDRYEESEREKPDDDMPTQRGTDYHVLLESAGDSFTQFRFSEEKDWEMDSFAASQMSEVFVDVAALAQILQQLPLHQRLNLEAEMVQVSTPVDLSSRNFTPQETTKANVLAASTVGGTSHQVPPVPHPASVSCSQVSSSAAESPPGDKDDDEDEELDLLLGLKTPDSGVSGNQSVSVPDEESSVPQRACEDVKEVTEEKLEEVKDKGVAPARKEVTEEDLEDWLDSMIS